ncbi:hypothetical protein QGM71_02620 [Virgibacillus sp. C22-A2]|uniref:Uncharacterized protein n=1 Tax=Virgibacillus tibetensis TaxID=3042313 RepID=A0ABU6KAU8_9BACI|nr:hypothetical protein [Virgibacillus sp. C22-A2]
MKYVRDLIKQRLDNIHMHIDMSKGFISETEQRIQKEKEVLAELEKEKEELELSLPPA